MLDPDAPGPQQSGRASGHRTAGVLKATEVAEKK
jgi:hypothetical protein